MNADRLLSHFQKISDAPDAIDRLRRFILDLAVRGKLVEQDPGESEAVVGSNAVRHNEKHQQQQRTVSLELPRASPSDFFFRLPVGWHPSHLGEVAECLDHLRQPINSAERDARTEGKPPSALYPYYGATQQQGWIDGYLFDEPLVLLGEDGAPFHDRYRPKAYLIHGKTWVNNHAHVFRPLTVHPVFLCVWLNVFDYTGRVVGATRAKLNKSKAIDIPVPLPPLPEQHRIVEKVDELMKLCDRLDASQKERESRRDRLVVAALNRLSQPTDPEQFKKDAVFHLSKLNRLSTKPEHIEEIRKAILNLAFTNGLTPMRGDSEKVSVREVAQLQNGYAFKSQWFKPKGIRLLRNANVGHGHLDWTETVCLSPEQAGEYERFELRAGDIVLSLDRPFISTGTKVARVAQEDLPSLLLQRVGRFVIQEDRLDADYLFRWLKSPVFAAQVDPGRSLGVPHISSKNVENAAIPLPPLCRTKTNRSEAG